MSLARRLTRALLDPDYIDDNAWVKKGRALFLAQQRDLTDPQMAIRLGLLLANDLGQMRVKFNAPGYLVEPTYRDDNRVLWEPLEVKARLPDRIQPDQHSGECQASFSRTTDTVRQLTNEAATVSAEIFNIVATLDINNIPTTTAFFYPEWDYRLGLVRSNRARIVEQPCDEADISIVTTIEEQTRSVLTRLKRINQTVRPNLLRRQKKYEEGDELDLEATIRAAVDIRQQRTPDMRIHSRFVRSVGQVSVLLLLDLSASTNQPLPDTNKTVLDLVRETAVLLAGTVTDIGDDFAIHGFSSNGRNQVEYYRLQDFAENYNVHIKMRLAGMTGKFSTRLGAAMRHAGHYLAQQSGTHKILLIVSDGEPADIDEADARYLVHDAAHAVKYLRSMGMDCFGLNLDTNTALQAAYIFGKKGYRMLEDISRLPAIMSAIYSQLRI